MRKEIYCFTFRNFEKTGGGSIRISGIINALAKRGVKVHLFSFFDNVPYLNDSVQYIQLPKQLSNLDKRKFQLALSFLPIKLVNKLFRNELQTLKSFFNNHGEVNQPILFFEYLDNSLAYWLKKNDIIGNYINDIHGIVPLEFRENPNKSLKSKAFFKLKERSAIALDQKTINSAKAILYPSNGVKDYFEKNVYKTKSIDSIVADEAINRLLLNQYVDSSIRTKLIQDQVFNNSDKIIMFIGDFKPFGGVEDLFDAFKILQNRIADSTVKLILIGDGQLHEKLIVRAKSENLTHVIRFIGRIPYTKLLSYQDCANILVCPDRDTVYSQLLPHIKFYDSISTGKVVVHGKFDFSEKLNPNEQFSIDFEPSNPSSLADKLEFSLNNLEVLSEKYAKNSEIARERFTYENSIEELYNYIK